MSSNTQTKQFNKLGVFRTTLKHKNNMLEGKAANEVFFSLKEAREREQKRNLSN